MTGADVIGLFPPGTSRDSDGMLRVGGCRLDELAAEYGTPALVVDEGAVRQRRIRPFASEPHRGHKCQR